MFGASIAGQGAHLFGQRLDTPSERSEDIELANATATHDLHSPVNDAHDSALPQEEPDFSALDVTTLPDIDDDSFSAEPDSNPQALIDVSLENEEKKSQASATAPCTASSSMRVFKELTRRSYTFVKEGIFSFYDDGLPISCKKTTKRILLMTTQTLFSVYTAWLASDEARKKGAEYTHEEAYLKTIAALAFSLSFLMLQKGAGQGIQYVTTLETLVEGEVKLGAATRKTLQQYITLNEQRELTKLPEERKEIARKVAALRKAFETNAPIPIAEVKAEKKSCWPSFSHR